MKRIKIKKDKWYYGIVGFFIGYQMALVIGNLFNWWLYS